MSWSEHLDPDTGHTYWFDQLSGATAWEKPDGAEASRSSSVSSLAASTVSAAPSGAADAPPPAPADEWREAKDPDGRVYYFNTRTQETRWDAPPPGPSPQEQPQGRGRAQTETMHRSQSSGVSLPPSITEEAADAEADGPPEYHKLLDPATGHHYYLNVRTGESSWEAPPANSTVIEQPLSPVPQSRRAAQERAEAKLAQGHSRAAMHSRSMSWAGGAVAERKAAAAAAAAAGLAAPRGGGRPVAGGARSMAERLPANFHRLPEPLAHDIQRFQMRGFAEQHFRTMKRRRGLVKKTVPLDDVIQWQKETIRGSLLRHADVKGGLDKHARASFKNVQQIMGDVPSKRSADSLVRLLVASGTGRPPMRDEIFCQLCKQVTRNPSSESAVAGWKAMAVCAAAFGPSRGFQDFLLAFLAGSFDSDVPEVEQLAPFCYWRVHRTIRRGPEPDAARASLEAVEGLLSGGVPSHLVSFGGSLDYIVRRQAAENPEAAGVPRVLVALTEAVTRLGGEGVRGMFRIAADAKQTEELRAEFEGGCLEVSDDTPVHVAGDLLKVWLRELSPPLFPHNLYNDCLSVADSYEKAEALCRERLSPAHLATADYLFTWLQEFAVHREVTKMDADNLAIVLSPNLVRNRDEDGDPSLAMKNAQREKNFVKTLIEGWRAVH